MATTNHGRLGDGIKIYTDAMRQLLYDRLFAAHNTAWFDQAVLPKLSRQQRDNLKRDREKAPKTHAQDFLEAYHFTRVVTKNFEGGLSGIWTDYKKTQSQLQAAESARNEWAHSRSGDMAADEVGNALFSMREILSVAGLAKEAAAIEDIRRDVLGIERKEAAVKEVTPAATGELPFWWQVCEPHTAFQNPATIDESLFAATLGGVHAGSARPEYLNPKEFFGHTYFTEHLKQTISDVVSRMNGGEGAAVTEMQTPFGGGKTHALLTLYHLINDPKTSLAVPGVREALGELRVPEDAKVIVLDGQERGIESVEKEDGASVFTLWGEIAHQAAPRLYFDLVQDSDGQGVAPGNAVFRQVLEEASPCLILLDELVSYLVKLKFSNSRRAQNLYRQTVQFLQELFQLVSNTGGVCVLMSLPKSKTEFGGIDPDRLQQELSVVPDIQARADRVASKRTPVNDDEVYTLMRRRLFKSVDEDAAARATQLYQESYQRLGGLFDATVLSADYRQNMLDAYPLHPELIDVLYKKWSTASDFPRTRTVLQLLASVVADQYVNRRESYTIQSSHVNLERERIRTKIVSASPGGGFDAVVAADIIGGEAHADAQDERRGAEYERHHIARGVATSLLMHSLGGPTNSGALPQELQLGTVAPNIGPEYVSEVLGSLEQALWYVHKEGERIRFQTRPNIYRVISQQAENQPEATVIERLREAMTEAVSAIPPSSGSDEASRVHEAAQAFRTLKWAGGDGAIADLPNLTVAILDPRFAVTQANADAPIDGRERIDELWASAGGGFREWRNSLLLIAPDRELWDRAAEVMREVLAYEHVVAEAEGDRMELSQAELGDLKSRLKEKQESLRTSFVTAYRWVFFPEEDGLSVLALPTPATAADRVVTRAIGRLADQNYGNPKVMPAISPVYFNSKIAPRLWEDVDSPLQLNEASRKFQRWTYLPMLPNKESALRDMIRQGIENRLWAIAVGDWEAGKYQRLVETDHELDDVRELFDGSAALVRGALRDLIRSELHPEVQQPEPKKAEDDGDQDDTVGAVPSPPPAPKRLSRVTIEVPSLEIAKTSNLQPYLFKVLQDADAGASLRISIEVHSSAGIPEEALDARIVKGFDQLGIHVQWTSED